MRTAELEIIQYETDKILDASKTLVAACVTSFKEERPSYSGAVLTAIDTTLRRNLHTQVVWNMPG